MPHKLTPMSFARLKLADRRAIAEKLHTEDGRREIYKLFTEYLSGWSEALWVDNEHLYHLGQDMREVCPADFHAALLHAIKPAIRQEAFRPFSEGFSARAPGSQGRPTRREFDKLLSGLASRKLRNPGFVASEFHDRHKSATIADGDADTLLRVQTRLGNSLLTLPNAYCPDAARIVASMAIEGLRWHRRVGAPWILLAKAFERTEDLRSAEAILWEGIHLTPEDVFIRIELARFIRRQEGRLPEAVALSRQTWAQFGSDRYALNHFAHILADSPPNLSSEQERERISELLAKTVLSHPASAPDKQVLAELVASAEFSPDHLHKLSDTIHGVLLGENNSAQHLKTAGEIGHIIFEAGALDASIVYFRRLVARNAQNVAFRNLLAKSLAATGSNELIDEAEALLRDTRKLDAGARDEYAANQLAELLYSRGDDQSQAEAVALLQAVIGDEASNNATSQKLLHSMSGRTYNVPLKSPPRRVSMTTQPGAEGAIDDAIEQAPIEFEIDDTTRVVADLRRYRFLLSEEGLPIARLQKEDMLKAISEYAGFLLADVLCARYDIPVEQNAQNAFSVGFERALKLRDHAALLQLSLEHPEYEPVSTVARALFGDEVARRNMRLITVDSADSASPSSVLRRRLSSSFQLIESGNVVERAGKDIIEGLRDVNEFLASRAA